MFLSPIIISRKSQVKMFELSEILEGSPNCTVKPKHESRGKYYHGLENNFLMLPNQKTLVGESESDSLEIEDMISKEAPVIIDEKLPLTMIFNRKINSLLAGYSNACVSQFERDSSGVMKKQKKYGDVGVGWVYASDCSGDIAAVGGDNGMISLINMKKKEVIQKGIRTCFEEVFSCLLYTSPSPRDLSTSRMPSSA